MHEIWMKNIAPGTDSRNWQTATCECGRLTYWQCIICGLGVCDDCGKGQGYQHGGKPVQPLLAQ